MLIQRLLLSINDNIFKENKIKQDTKLGNNFFLIVSFCASWQKLVYCYFKFSSNDKYVTNKPTMSSVNRY